MTFRNTEAVVFIVDDDDAMRDSIAYLVQSVGRAVETYESAEAFLARVDSARAGCLILDVRMPGMGGLDLQQVLQVRGIQLPVIVITGHGDIPMAVRAMRAGAVSFLEKPFNDQALLDHVGEAMRIDREVRRQREQTAQAALRLAALTAREREVLEAVVAGKQNRMIAEELGLSVKTVEAHRHRMMGKMQARTAAGLALAVLQAQGKIVSGTSDGLQ